MTARIAIIGAGLSGLAVATKLHCQAEVHMFEKSRGYGGRMATRIRNGYQFDHGAQFFTVRSAAFRNFIRPYVEQGVVARWDARFVEIDGDTVTSRRQWRDDPAHYVAVPGMHALGQALALPLNVTLQTQVASISPVDNGWQLYDSEGKGLGRFDWVVLAIPAAQASALLPDDCSFRKQVADKTMLGCYTLMLGFKEPLSLDWDAALIKRANISWASSNHSKPGLPPAPTLLVHATNRWAEANMDRDKDDVKTDLLRETERVLAIDTGRAEHVDLHRWRYANIGSQDGARFLLDAERRLAAVGDWCIKGRIESACLSGLEAADSLQDLVG